MKADNPYKNPTNPLKHLPRTPKQKKFVKEYVKTGNAGLAAKRAYNILGSDATARNMGSELVAKLDMSAMLDKVGVTDAFISRTIKGAMKAKRMSGQPDWVPRLEGAKIAAKIKGHFKERVEHSGVVGVYPILGGASAMSSVDKKNGTPSLTNDRVGVDTEGSAVQEGELSND